MGLELYLALAPIAAGAAFTAFFLIFPRRKETAVRSLLVYLALVIFLILTNMAELTAKTSSLTIFFAKLQYISFIYIPVAWLSFSLRFTGWLTKTNKPLLRTAIFGPLILLSIVLTNEYHLFVWQTVTILSEDGYSFLRPKHGPFFWIIAAYSWALLFLGTLLVLRSFFSPRRLFHRQSLWIVAGTLLPGLTNFLNLSNIIPSLQKDFTPVGFALSGVCFVFGMLFHRLFWIMPVARSVLLEKLNIGILVLDKHGWIIDHNPEIEKLLHIEPNTEGLSYSLFPLLAELIDKAAVFDNWPERSLQSGEFQTEQRLLEWTIQPSAEDFRGIILTATDISDKKRLLLEMESIKSEFVNREKLAAIGRITAGLAHEINNPLAYIKSNARALSTLIHTKCASVMGENYNDPDVEEIQSVQQSLYEGLTRIEEQIASLLAFSRQGTNNTKTELFNLNDSIEITINFLCHELGKDLNIAKKTSTLPSIHGIRSEINQVIFNILTNAVHAVRERKEIEGEPWHGQVSISSGSNNAVIWCEIENNGIPITDEVEQHLFDLFYTTKSEKWGTGLGLNLSREIVEKHHQGKLVLISKDPVCFRIELPITK